MDDKHIIAATAIIVKNGKYLITKRSLNKKAFPGKWTLPGGRLEVNDYINEPKDTSEHWYNVLENLLRREVKEETNLDIKNIKYLTSMTFMRGEDPVLVVSLYVDYDRGEVILNKESVDYKWVSLNEAKNYDLIEGIYDELEMLDKLLKGDEVGEWSKCYEINEKNVEQQIGKGVEKELKENCVFCNEDNLNVIRESENTISFLSSPYLIKGHCLVIPKEHYENILDVPENVLIELIKEVRKVKKLLVERFGARGVDIRQNYRLFLEENELKVNHLHFHLIPREFEDELYKKSMIYEKEVFKKLGNAELERLRRILKNERKEEIVIEDSIYGREVIKELILINLINSKPVQRLKEISQYGIPEEYYHKKGYSRYEHSIGVFLLLRRLNADIKEQIAGLLHDVSHTAFSHVIDWTLGDPTKEDYQDNNHLNIIKNSEIKEILEKEGLDYKEIAEIESFSLLEKEIPSLCADRIDYVLRELRDEGLDTNDFVLNLVDKDGQIVFKNKEIAEKFAKEFSRLQNEHWAGDQARGRYYILSRIFRKALNNKILSIDDFYLTEKEVLKKLNESKDVYILENLELLRDGLIVESVRNGSGILLKKKFRYINPEIFVDGRVRKLSEISEGFREILKKEKEKSVVERRVIFKTRRLKN